MSTLTLPPQPTLLSHTLSPTAIAKCHISDLWKARFLVPATTGAERDYRPEGLIAIDNYPTRLVEVVGWVAGVDHNDSYITIYREHNNSRFCVVRATTDCM